MAGTTTLILGAGFGGLNAARTLRDLAGAEHRIVIIDRAAAFCAGSVYPWAMMGDADLGAMSRPIRDLVPAGVELVPSAIEAIDIDRGRVRTAAGEFSGDHIIIALGAEVDMHGLPGLAEGAHTFFTAEGARRAAPVVASFRGGDLVILVTRTPFKCPPAPYETAMSLHADLRERGILGTTRFHVYTMEGAPMATAGPEMGALIRGELEQRGIGFHPRKKTAVLHPDRGEIEFEDGDRVHYDLVLAVPPHVAPRVVAESGLLNASGWIPVNPQTLELAEWDGPHPVFAIGDINAVPLPGAFDPRVPLALPKAGVFAAAQGMVVARRIAARFGAAGGAGQPDTFDGTGFCYVETGAGMAMRADGSFFDLPHPHMRREAPSAARFREKQEWVRKLPEV